MMMMMMMMIRHSGQSQYCLSTHY